MVEQPEEGAFPDSVPDGSDHLYMSERIREFRSMSAASTLDRLSSLREDQRLEHSLYGFLKANGWPDEVAIRVRLEPIGGDYVPVIPRYLNDKVAYWEYDSEQPNAIHRWVNRNSMDLARLSEQRLIEQSRLAAMVG